MMKKTRRILSIMLVGLLSIYFLLGNDVLVAFAYNQAEYISYTDSDILTNIRLSQMDQYLEDFERVELVIDQGEGGLENEGVVPCTPASANPVSVCVGSVCAGSICVGSGCGVSYCVGSACAGSLCGGSGCGVSNCGGSACGISICGGSACGASGCAGSLCAGCKK